jgi:hypothetical protein
MESCRKVRDFTGDERRKTIFGLMNSTKPVFWDWKPWLSPIDIPGGEDAAGSKLPAGSARLPDLAISSGF